MKTNTYSFRYENIHQKPILFATEAKDVLEAIGIFLAETRHPLESILKIEVE